MPLKSKAIIIFGLCILCDPEHNCRQHQSHVLRYVRVAIVCVLFRVVHHDIFEHEERLDGPIIKCLATSNRVVRRTTLPANPPAIKENPINRKRRARHTALESPYSSPLILSLSIRLMTSMPRREQMPGIQSTNSTCTGGGIWTSSGGGWA